jgi:hypothetical protein
MAHHATIEKPCQSTLKNSFVRKVIQGGMHSW